LLSLMWGLCLNRSILVVRLCQLESKGIELKRFLVSCLLPNRSHNQLHAPRNQPIDA
jgi:hypothetical protein